MGLRAVTQLSSMGLSAVTQLSTVAPEAKVVMPEERYQSETYKNAVAASSRFKTRYRRTMRFVPTVEDLVITVSFVLRKIKIVTTVEKGDTFPSSVEKKIFQHHLNRRRLSVTSQTSYHRVVHLLPPRYPIDIFLLGRLDVYSVL